jgi:hypothetical protein
MQTRHSDLAEAGRIPHVHIDARLPTDTEKESLSGGNLDTECFGQPDTDGSWRIYYDGTNLLLQPRVAGAYTSIVEATTGGAITLSGTLTLPNAGLHLLDTNASHDLIISPGSDLTADRILTLTTGDAARTVTLSGNPTLADWFDQDVKQAAGPTFASITLPDEGWIGIGAALERIVFDTAGDVAVMGANFGIGTTAPQSLLHGYDSFGGFMYWEGQVSDGGETQVLPDAAGDVAYSLIGYQISIDRAGHIGKSGPSLSTPASGSNTTSLIGTGSATVVLRLYSTGRLTIDETVGTTTIYTSLWLIWQ